MSNLEYYNEKIALIQAIPDCDIKAPNIPVDVFLQEAENLYHWCREDREELTAKGLDWSMVQEIQARCGALREAQSRWVTLRFGHEDSEKQWMDRSPVAYDLRNELLHMFRFAYRKHPNILGRVREIGQDTGHADMIQDLNDLSVLGRDNPEPLKAINLDMALLDQAANLAREMSRILGAATRERAWSRGAKKLRDQAFTYLEEIVDEVRGFGQYVYRKNETRFRGYRSEYNRRVKGKSHEKQEPVEAAID